MDINLILNEIDRLSYIEDNEDFRDFYYQKLEELDFDSPTEDIETFFKSLNEEWVEEYDLDDLIEVYNKILESGEDNINERFINTFINEKFKKVIRGGKKIKKRVCRPGYKVVDGKCVKMKASEKRARSKSQRKGARKRKTKKASMKRSKKISDRKRSRYSL